MIIDFLDTPVIGFQLFLLLPQHDSDVALLLDTSHLLRLRHLLRKFPVVDCWTLDSDTNYFYLFYNLILMFTYHKRIHRVFRAYGVSYAGSLPAAVA